MSISALSSNLVSDLSQPQWQNPFKEIRQDFQQLAGALQSGDLSGAQSAFSSIQQLLQANGNSSSPSSPNTLQSDFAALGQALSSGSLSQAQSAFSQLKSDFQTAHQSRYSSANGPSQGQDQYVSSSSQGPNAITQALEDYTQLSSDIQSGDLTDAQTAYTSLQQLVGNPNPSTPTPNPTTNPTTPPTTIQTDFASLGQAIQSGDVTQAQSAFSQLQTDFQTATQAPASPAATTTTTTPVQNPVQAVRQDYTELASALQSGDLTTAQSAFTALQQALQTQTGASTTSATSDSSDPIANDLSALGQALSSGNLTQAQSAFSQLQTDIRTAQQSAASQNQGFTPSHKAGGHGHHHHGGGGGYSGESSTSSSSTTSTTSTGVNVYA